MSEPRPSVAALLTAPLSPPPADATVQQLRASWEAVVVDRLDLVRDRGPLHEVRDLETPGGVRVREYLPSPAASSGPVHVHLHGGGWWMGGIATVDAMARELAHDLGVAVLSVDYRLAPEHPFPAALDDVDEVVEWAARRHPVVTLGGESAGANLAAAATLRRKDEGRLLPAALWLDVPAVDLALPVDASSAAYGTGFGLELAQLPTVVQWYGAPVDSAYASPARGVLAGLPPTIVTTAELDPLRDQGEAFAAALRDAGVDVELRRAPGHVHGSSWYTALDDETAAWHDEVVGLLVRHLPVEVAA